MRLSLSKLWLAGLAILLTAAPAVAADLPSATRPPPPPLPLAISWTGFYLGGQIGAGWASDRLTESTLLVPPLTGAATTEFTGALGGAHAGYNWQMGSWVLGAEADAEATSLKRTGACLIQDSGVGNAAPGACFPQVFSPYSFRTQLPWQGSIRARLGYAYGDFLLYGTGGAAFADVATRYWGLTPAPVAESFGHRATGFTIGGGFEYALTDHWRAGVEYRFTDFGKLADPVTSAGIFWNGYNNSHEIRENAVRVGLTYLFAAASN